MAQFTKKTHPARDELSSLTRNYPDLWKLGEEMRIHGKAKIGWPDWCYMPMSGWYSTICHMQGIKQMGNPDQFHLLSLASGLGAWRMTQGIYRIDPVLYSALRNTEVAGDIPSSIIFQLPEWCIYIETPDLMWAGDPLHGVWVYLESDHDTGRAELRILTHGHRRIMPTILHIGDWSLAESIDRAVNESMRHAGKVGGGFDVISSHVVASGHYPHEWIRQLAEPVLSMVLYICTQSDEITGRRGVPANPESKRTRRDGWRIFPADGVSVWDVGVRIGAALRAAYQREEMGLPGAPTGVTQRPHVRRAHWHTFVSGARKTESGDAIPADKRRRDVRWMPPIPVNITDLDDMPAVIRSVK